MIFTLFYLESSENNKSLAVKGLASAIDYSYILVKNPDDPDSGLKLNKNQIIYYYDRIDDKNEYLGI